MTFMQKQYLIAVRAIRKILNTEKDWKERMEFQGFYFNLTGHYFKEHLRDPRTGERITTQEGLKTWRKPRGNKKQKQKRS